MAGHFTFVQHPIVQWPVIFKLQGAKGMRNAFNGVGQRMRKIIRGIDVPRSARPVMRNPSNPVERRIAHIDVRRGHVDFGTEHVRPFFAVAGTHSRKQVKIFFHKSRSIRALLARLRQGPPVVSNLVRGQTVHVGLAFPDQQRRVLVQLLEIIRGKETPVLPVEPQPAHVFLNGLDVFHVFLGGIGVVEPQIAQAP